MDHSMVQVVLSLQIFEEDVFSCFVLDQIMAIDVEAIVVAFCFDKVYYPVSIIGVATDLVYFCIFRQLLA